MKFSLKESEYIELNKLLKIMNLVGTGGESNVHITEGRVLVNGAVEIQKRKKLRVGDKVLFNKKEILIEA